MEEQNKNPEKKENEVQTSQENTPQNATPTRSYVLMILAGCYLLYTGYRLCKNVIDGVDGGSWGFFAAGIGFLIVRCLRRVAFGTGNGAQLLQPRIKSAV